MSDALAIRDSADKIAEAIDRLTKAMDKNTHKIDQVGELIRNLEHAVSCISFG